LVDDSLELDPQRVTEHFNKFFVEIGEKLAVDIPRSMNDALSYLGPPTQQSIFVSPVTSQELRSCVSRLNNSSPGYDGIKAELIKKSLDIILVPLLHVVNVSFSTGVFPDELKMANVTPIFKSNDPLVVGNYRPIAVLSVFSKIFEKLMYARIYNFLSMHNILYPRQFGFRSGFSTEMALLSATDLIYKALDDWKHVIGFFLDMRKAFDTVNLEILLGKLHHLGIRGSVHQWFSSFLLGRR